MLCVRIWYKYVTYWMFWTCTLRILRLKKGDSKNHEVINNVGVFNATQMYISSVNITMTNIKVTYMR